MTQALPAIQAPLQPGDRPSARTPDDGSPPRLTCPKVIELGGHNGAGLVQGQAELDQASDKAQLGEVYLLKRAGRLAGAVSAFGLSDSGLQGKRIHGLRTPFLRGIGALG
jgi:hypothetical protein